MNPTENAIVNIPSQRQVRPAAYVWQTSDGAAWIEPSYRDPIANTQPAFHRLPGKVEQRGEGFVLVEPDGSILATFRPYTAPGADDADGSCTAALLAWSDLLVEHGVTMEAERFDVEAQLAEELA